MKIEVLLSTMHQVDMHIVERCNIKSDALIINQSDINNVNEIVDHNRKIRMISTTERGLSNSRNMALENATGDVCILCDDDVVYCDQYVEIVKEAFEKVPDADIMVFNIERISQDIRRTEEKIFTHIFRILPYKTYGSVHIAFKRKSIESKKILFNTLFGTGSGMYNMGEDAIFFMNAHKAHLHCYVYPACIAKVYFDSSSWFKGYNDHYFYDVGAYLSVVYPKIKHLMKYYYPLRMRGLSDLSGKSIIKNINAGMKGYKLHKNYEQFTNLE